MKEGLNFPEQRSLAWQTLERGLNPETTMAFIESVVELTGSDYLKRLFEQQRLITEEEIAFTTANFREGVDRSVKLSQELLDGKTFAWWDIEEYRRRTQSIREVTSAGQFVAVLGEYALNRVGGQGPLMIVNHQELFGEDNECFIDCLTNATVTNFGQGFPLHLTSANTINLLTGGAQCSPYHPSPLMDAAARALISIMPIPPEGAKVAWFNSGGDAVSVAIAAAEKYTTRTHGENGRRKAVFFKEAYHGNIEGRSGRVTSGINQMFHKEDQTGVELEFPNKLEEVEPVLEQIKNLIKENKLSCVVIESTQGDGGGVSMHPDFFSELIKLSLDYQFPVVVDEVQSGFGRSGRIFDVEYLLDAWRNSSYVQNEGYPENPPFIIAVAKSMTNGAVPGSAVVFPQEYAVLERAQGLNTYSAHPTTLAATLATVSLMGNDLLQMIQHKREVFEQAITPYLTEVGIVGLRGHGLHLFLELNGINNQVLQAELIGRRRILTGTVARNALRVHPPLNTPNKVLEAVAHAIGQTVKEIKSGKISPETLKILEAGPSGLAVR